MSVVASQSSPSPASLTTNVSLFITAAPVSQCNPLHRWPSDPGRTSQGPSSGVFAMMLWFPSSWSCINIGLPGQLLVIFITVIVNHQPSLSSLPDLCWLYNVIISAIISPRYLHCALFSVIMLNVKIPDCIFMYISSVAQYKSKSDDNSRVSVKINYYEKSVMVYDLSISGLCCVYVGF